LIGQTKKPVKLRNHIKMAAAVMKEKMEPLAVSAKHLGGLLDISTRQVWAMHAAGTLGPEAIFFSKRMTRWDAAEVQAWWAACREAGRIINRQEWLRKEKQ